MLPFFVFVNPFCVYVFMCICVYVCFTQEYACLDILSYARPPPPTHPVRTVVDWGWERVRLGT